MAVPAHNEGGRSLPDKQGCLSHEISTMVAFSQILRRTPLPCNGSAMLRCEKAPRGAAFGVCADVER